MAAPFLPEVSKVKLLPSTHYCRGNLLMFLAAIRGGKAMDFIRI
jgi:hypothetical protein